MRKASKRYKENETKVDKNKSYPLGDAVDILKAATSAKFDESLEISLLTGVDPKKSDQQVRSTILLPHGTGKKARIVVLAKGDNAKAGLDAGAMEAGDAEIIERIKGGWTDFDALIATPDMMREVGKLGKVLGPRGLMPTPKAGTVTKDVAKAVADLMKGKVEFKVDKSGCINLLVGILNFTKEQIVENIEALIGAIARAKPPTAKGTYLKSLHLASTMGPGIKIDVHSISHG